MPRDLGSRWSAPSAQVVGRNRRSSHARPRFEGLETRSLLSADVGTAAFAQPADENPHVEHAQEAIVEELPASGSVEVVLETPVDLSESTGHRPGGRFRPPTQGSALRVPVVASLIEADHAPDSTGTLTIDYEYGSVLLDHVLQALGSTEPWGPLHEHAPEAEFPPTDPPPWIIDEITREFAALETLQFPGTLVQEPEFGLTGPERPLIWITGDQPMTMIGSIGAGEGPDYYAFRPGSQGFQLKFTAFDPTTDLADLLSIFDAYEGLVVSCMMSQTENSITISIYSEGGFEEREVIIRIGPDEGSPARTGQEQYALSFLPNEPSSGGGGSEFGSPPGVGNTGTDQTPQPPTNPTGDSGSTWGDGGWGTLPEPWNSEDHDPEPLPLTSSPTGPGESTEDLEETPVALGPVALGPLPALAASPFGGILGFGDAALLLDRHEAAVIDLHLIDLPGAGDWQFDPSRPDVTDAGLNLARSGLDGSSELPIIAAAYPRVSIDALPMELLNAEASPEVQPTSEVAAVVAGAHATDADKPEGVENSPTQQRVVRWTVAGMTALMAMHLLLPDLGFLLPLVRPRQRGRRRWFSGSWYRPPRSIG